MHLLAKKPYQRATDSGWQAEILIRINEYFLSLFCFYRCFYSAQHCNRGSIEHEHNNNRTSL
ncbi:hypothetical protein EIY72_12075 [Pseudomonas vancouverensis]|uniref:Uncharacterized protein n=1 Tax=Pseudomonas vancouverensis TaxID=95300 RepID=A0A4V2X9J0_PSEVA|nr:hypothetical protein F7R09_16170 [Pseudomonas vancouverensis]TDB63945.1 hypothetical protein EIY72_12075 [Pseudomonas vancouverensis]